MTLSRRALVLTTLGLLTACGCDQGPTVVVYTALDREFSEPVFKKFEEETGIRVLAKYDTEASKTFGLAQMILEERAHPRCDVFWNNEIVHTIRLAKQGVLDTYKSPSGAGIPDAFKDPEGRWHGFAARARILIVNNDLVPEGREPRTLAELTQPRWKGKVAIAKPPFGTTGAHVACLFAHLGPEKARKLLMDLKANGVRIEAGNRQVAERVAAGDLHVGLTDTDDAMGEIDRGSKVRIVYLDVGPDQTGTLFIPNTLSIVKSCPHPAAARRLVDYLLSAEVEAMLAQSPSAQIPLNPAVEVQARVKGPRDVRAMPIDFARAADQWDAALEFATEQFTR